MMMSGTDRLIKLCQKKNFKRKGFFTYRPVTISRSGRGRTSSRWDDDTDTGSI